MRNVDNGGGYACEGREYVQKSVFSSQFSSETKTSLNKYNLQKIYCGFHFVSRILLFLQYLIDIRCGRELHKGMDTKRQESLGR